MRKSQITLAQLSENNFDILNNEGMCMLKGGKGGRSRKSRKSRKSKRSRKHNNCCTPPPPPCGCPPSTLPVGVELYCGPVAYSRW